MKILAVVFTYLFSNLLQVTVAMPLHAARTPIPSYSANPNGHVASLLKRYRHRKVDVVLVVEIEKQLMHHYAGGTLVKTYKVSTSKFGIGNKDGTNQTPLGVHFIKDKIGRGAAKGAIFKSRQNTGKVATIYTDETPAKADYVTSRIMWLQGLEPGTNRGKGIDSYNRYIYIHGTAEEGRIGKPASHGCVRMYNNDVIELFDKVPEGTLVNILP